MTRVTIAVCTFQRESVTETLLSLMKMTLPDGVTLDIVVVDNDETPSARDRVEAVAETAPRPVRYVHAPARNISIARNAALDASDAPYLAFIDDDELATEGWLAALFQAMNDSDADIVLGPVAAVYRDDAPGWMRAESVHSARPVWVDGEIRTGYTCNVLMDLGCPALNGLRFDPAFGVTGGEDTMFFAAAHRAGARISFAPDALVTEAVSPSRESLKWLTARRLRSGQTHARLLIGVENRNRWLVMGPAAAKAGYCAVATALCLPFARRRNVSALRCLFHAGVLLGLVQADGRPRAEVRP